MSVIFGKRLKELREEQGLSQQKLGDTLFVTRVTISAWETNKQEPNIETLKKLCDIFEVSTDYLTGYRNEPN